MTNTQINAQLDDAAALKALNEPNSKLKSATFAGGCFWCMEPPYDKLKGVTATISGYTGGDKKDPSYQQVVAGGTGHREALQVIYDPAEVSYKELLAVFWHNVDPLDDHGQFCDKGFQYTTAIFAHNVLQRKAAIASKQTALQELAAHNAQQQAAHIVTEILPASTFYVAEGYHQDYYRKSAVRYKFYRYSCGRDKRLTQLWGSLAGKGSGT